MVTESSVYLRTVRCDKHTCLLHSKGRVEPLEFARSVCTITSIRDRAVGRGVTIRYATGFYHGDSVTDGGVQLLALDEQVAASVRRPQQVRKLEVHKNIAQQAFIDCCYLQVPAGLGKQPTQVKAAALFRTNITNQSSIKR